MSTPNTTPQIAELIDATRDAAQAVRTQADTLRALADTCAAWVDQLRTDRAARSTQAVRS